MKEMGGQSGRVGIVHITSTIDRVRVVLLHDRIDIAVITHVVIVVIIHIVIIIIVIIIIHN